MPLNIRGAQSSSFVIPVGGSIDVGAAGEFVRCLESSHTSFNVSISGNAPMYFAGGVQYTTRSPEQFDMFTIVNIGVTPLTVVMAWGYGEFADNRFNVGGTVKVDDDESQTILGTIFTQTSNTRNFVQTMLDVLRQSSGQKTARMPYTSIENSSYASVSNATTTIVAAGSNVNGVLIKLMENVSANNQSAYVTINGNRFLETTPVAGTIFRCSERDIYVPAGQAIAAYSSAAGAKINMFYEVL